MSKIRTLVVDDSVVTRRLVSDFLAGQGDFEIVGVAAHGRIALSKLPNLEVDAVTLDLEMPEMNGIETLEAIRQSYPKLPVVIFSSSDSSIASIGKSTFPLGPTEIVRKPETMASGGNPESAWEGLAASLRGLCGRRRPPSQASAADMRAAPPRPEPAPVLSAVGMPAFSPAILAIGASTGGPNAVEAVLSTFSRPPSVPIVITQHMPSFFTGLFAARLTSASCFPVVEASDGDVVLPGRGYVAPGDYHMGFAKEGNVIKVRLNQRPPENSCRPAVDVMYQSLVEIYGGRILAAVLTGMGQDGMRGAALIRAAGGRVLVQDEASSVVWGMPGFIAKSGLADAIIPLSSMGQELARRLDGVSFNSSSSFGVPHHGA